MCVCKAKETDSIRSPAIHRSHFCFYPKVLDHYQTCAFSHQWLQMYIICHHFTAIQWGQKKDEGFREREIQGFDGDGSMHLSLMQMGALIRTAHRLNSFPFLSNVEYFY